MQDTLDPIPHWTRQLAHLRARALKLGVRRPAAESPLGEVVDEALTVCDSLLRDLAGAQLDCRQLRAEVHAETVAWKHLFEIIPTVSVLTDGRGVILDANRAAGLFFNVSAKHLKERQLLLFTADRDAFGSLLQRLAGERRQLRTSLTWRPRERRPVEAEVIVAPASPDQSDVWLWFFVSSREARVADRQHSLAAIPLSSVTR